MRPPGWKAVNGPQEGWEAGGSRHHSQSILRNDSANSALQRQFGDGRAVGPACGQLHGETGVRDAKAAVMAEEEAGAIGAQVRISQVKMTGAMNQDVLDIPVSEVC